ncbi:MAG TPA: hypothetical protein VGJ05_05750 [Fimbriiglobus sp.]|jgi:hypothetical protein
MTPDSPEFERALTGPGPAPVPIGLADRISAAAVWDYKVRRFTRRAAWAGASFAAVIAVWFALPPAERTPRPDTGGPPMAMVIDPFREADTALASLSRSATDRVTSSAPVLPVSASIFPSPEPVTAGPSVSGFPETARAAFEPVTATASRAVGRFFQDLGSATGATRGGS